MALYNFLNNSPINSLDALGLTACPPGYVSGVVAGMKWLQGTHTQRYNRRHQVFGHLFQGRYKAILVEAEDANYLHLVSTYIHLNPARAGLIRIDQEKLKSYRWSSYPWYLRRDCPEWIGRGKVLGSLGLAETDAKGYEAYMEGRVLELGIKAGRRELEWKSLRRGWYVGKPTFVEKLQRWLGRAVQGRKRESQSGAARQVHDQAAANKLLAAGLDALGLSSSQFSQLPKAAPEKVAMAWWLCRRTTVPLRWVSERLHMGHYTRSSQAVSRMNQEPGRKLDALRKRLLKLEARLNEMGQATTF